MTRHRIRLRALTRPELQTVGYLSGLAILVWWAFTDASPQPVVVASVSSLLIVQRYVGGRSKESKNHESPVGPVQDVAAGSKRGNKRSGAGGGGGTGRRYRSHHLRHALNRRFPPVPGGG